MSSKYWIKLYIEIIDDYKMGNLSRSLRYRVIEMFCLAGECDEEGFLPPLNVMAWKLRENPEQLESDLMELAKFGILDQREGRWFVVNFAKRQAPSPNAERVREYRKRQRNVDVTKSYARNAPDTDTDTDTESEEEQNPPASFPQTPLEAQNHPDIKLFYEVSKVTPGRNDYAVVIDAIQLLRKQHPNESELESYLMPFWLAWQNRKGKDGKAYSRTNPAWLTDWAVNNDIPKNGSEPTSVKRGYLEIAP